jgi:hypothetical protein
VCVATRGGRQKEAFNCDSITEWGGETARTPVWPGHFLCLTKAGERRCMLSGGSLDEMVCSVLVRMARRIDGGDGGAAGCGAAVHYRRGLPRQLARATPGRRRQCDVIVWVVGSAADGEEE